MRSTEQQLVIRNALVDNYSSYAEGLDSKQWDLVRACFADEVLIDYGEISAATGSPDVPRKIEQWMEHLQNVINGFDITRHAITNHRFVINDNVVSCRAYLSADHILFPEADNPHIGPEDNITIVGEYTNTYGEFDGAWKITKSELVVNFSHGNLGLFERATQRVMAQMGRV